MEFGGGNDLGKLFHIGRLDVDNVETLILDVQIPQIDAEVVTTDECLTVTVDGDTVDVIGMSIGVCSPGNSSYDSIVMCHSREFQLCSILEAM
jgi:hypothetical protein